MTPVGVEILDVMMSMLSGDKDDFGKDEVPPLPLSFDRVCRGHSQQSTPLLFRLPTEILGMILQWVAPDSLASLALVNRDCLQWARSRRFASVQLTYSNGSLDLIRHLLNEASGHPAATSSTTPMPKLGLCIRRITVATNPAWVAVRHGVELRETELSEEERTKRMVDASSAFFGKYIPNIQRLLNPVVLPNLELLDWEDKIALSQSFFEALVSSRIKYLKLYRVKLNKQFDITAQSVSTTHSWPLRTLYLELISSYFSKKKINTAPLSVSLLCLCSRTLEDLRFTSWERKGSHSFTNSNINEIPQFPNLQRLSLGTVSLDDSSLLEALVCNSLRYLEVGERWTPIYRDFFENRGTISNLHTFVWSHYGDDEPPHSFLNANPRIAKLAMPYPVSSTTLETHIIPSLAQNFSNLTSLSLVWKGTSISDSALQQICSLETLKQIHLSAGEQCGWKHDWLIDHNTLRRHLRTLPLLGKLAFSRDSYIRDISGIGPDLYYSQWEFTQNPKKQWEPRHRRRMLKEAKKYVRLMPQLEWMYLGQLPMVVETNTMTSSKFVRLLSEERDGCRTLLRTMFGGDPD